MRGTVAKRLRKEARRMSGATSYGGCNDARHGTVIHYKENPAGRRNYSVATGGTVICTGYRRVYQDMKGNYKRIMASAL